ncbi:hypothetical protein NsoK4_08215 [Nitrosopumilus sp. K4]|uniref:hypothetical protein n=1 Tax=Nitrosopumilus sp. K4 TaxID=2795383 RepID=UPI001BA57B09|nr:hypothetical protein [Nitrosopumilus sp. K4]QUC64399.1 hypothetical protein NsoK4_08215 [Nitrosopumilus sp. K4]
MKEVSLGYLDSFFMQGKLLFKMDGEWKEFLGSNPGFEVIIDKDQRCCLIGPKVRLGPSRTKQTPAKEDKHD